MGKKEDDYEKLVEITQKQSDEIKRLNAVLIDMTNNAKRFGWTEGR
jgi:hypothetical protein